MANRLNQYPTRTIQDGTLTTTANFANAANTSTNAIDLGADTPWPAIEQVGVIISTTNAAANSGNAAVITLYVQDANVNLAANFATIATMPSVQINSNGAVFPVTTANLSLPPGTRQYIRVFAALTGGDGNAYAGTVTMKLVF